MKVLIHTDEYYPTAQACSYRMQVLADAFMETGAEVVVITSSANKENGGSGRGKTGFANKENRDPGGRKEKIIYSPAMRMRNKKTLTRLLNNLSFGFTSVLSSFKAGKADVVITTSPPPLSSISGWMIAKLKGAKLVYDVRDIWPDVAVEMGSFPKGSFYYRVFRRIAWFMYRHADIVTTVSPGKVKKLRRYVGHIEKKNKNNAAQESHAGKVWMVGNGYDMRVEEYPINQSLVEKYDMENIPTCIYVGNIGLAQGLDALLKVASETKHKGIQFLLFGKGAEKELLEKKAMEAGLDQVRFCGLLPHEDVRTILEYAAVSFVPLKSAKMKDSIPTKLYEALGIGCPVLLVAEGDACGILDETGLGRHISPDHPEELTWVFDELMDDYDEIAGRSESAKAVIHEKYTRQKLAREFALRLRERSGAGE
ncbi:MAG TPA: hypothetical protein DCM49_06935 [Lachnospiraceae bacterium]|nr:hypothetical protein [Lachnospiraceae bacterium]